MQDRLPAFVIKQLFQVILAVQQGDYDIFIVSSLLLPNDYIFARDRVPFEPIDEAKATVITCAESKEFLAGIGISGEIISTPSHSPDSVSLLLDDGDCIVGDLQPREYLAAYEQDNALKADWDAVLRYRPRRILYAHANERVM